MANNESSKSRKRRKITQRDGPGCLLCGLESKLTLHHVKKRSEGGSDDVSNLCLLCEDCHVYWHQNEAPDFFKWVEQTRLFLCKVMFDD